MGVDEFATGIRKRIVACGENYYLSMFENEDKKMEIFITCPRENSPANRQQREALELVCQEICGFINNKQEV